MTQITLGNFFTIDGKQVLGGAGGSGLDTQSIINGLVAVKSQPATNDQTKLTANGKVTNALNQFASLLSSFQTAAQALSNPPGVGNQADNVFDFTTGSVGNGGSNYLSVTTQPGAALQTYNISNISSIATAASQTTGTFTVGSTSASVVSANPISGTQYQFAPGTITFPQTLAISQFATGDQGSGDITATVNSVANLQVGDQVTVSGAVGTLDGITAGVINGTQTITAIDTTNNTITYTTAGTASAGNQTSNEGGNAQEVGPGQTITLNEGDSLNTVANDFNAVSSETGIAATIVQISSDQYQLSFTATNTGSANDFNLANGTTLLSDPSGVLSNIGLTEQQSTGTFTVNSTTAVVASTSDITGTTGIQFTPGSYSINGQTVTISNNDTLADVANDFNSVSAGTGVTAHIVQAGTSGYQLAFTQNPGDGGFNLANITGVDLGATTAATTQQSTGTFTIANPNTVVASDIDITGSTGIQFTTTAGTLNYTINGKTVTINAGDTLTDVMNDFNNVSGTGVTASIVQAGTSGYQLVLTQNSDAGNFDLSGTVTGVGLAATTAGTTVVAGTNANFDINGIPITRSTNNIDDVINGVTFHLTGTTPDNTTIYPVTISADTTTIQNSIVNFVDAYNAIQTFATQQTQLNSSNTYASSAILATNTTFRQTMANINGQITSQVAGLSSGINSLSDVGITLTTQAATSTTPQVNNILTVDDGELSTALSTNLSGVEGLFGLNMTSNNPNLTLFSETNALAATSFTIGIDPGGNTFTATIGSNAPINLTATLLPGNSGYLLTGPDGSALAGLQLIYASTAPATINVSSITSGIANQLYNTSNAATTANTGTLAVALAGVQTQNTTLQNDITRIDTQVSEYQQQLLQQYGALESSILFNNNLLDSLQAQTDAQLVQAGQ